MSVTKLDELNLDVEELNKLYTISTRQKVKDTLLIEIRKLETQIIKLKEQSQNNEINSLKKTTTAPNRCYDVKLTNYAWDQSDKYVKIFVTLSKVHSLPKENTFATFSERSMELTVKELENRNYILSISNLLEPIDTKTSYWKVKTDMVVVFLSKTKENQNWSHLTASEKKAKEPKTTPKMDSSGDPSAGLMDLMKQMYDDGDDEMKRTIAKAWTESRGKSGGMDF
uniref:Calcyclin-binding protein n=1 Tax=Clastoptera arizonana TaxID=38151 RepID=A0A1B6CCB6_9HEMI